MAGYTHRIHFTKTLPGGARVACDFRTCGRKGVSRSIAGLKANPTVDPASIRVENLLAAEGREMGR